MNIEELNNQTPEQQITSELQRLGPKVELWNGFMEVGSERVEVGDDEWRLHIVPAEPDDSRDHKVFFFNADSATGYAVMWGQQPLKVMKTPQARLVEGGFRVPKESWQQLAPEELNQVLPLLKAVDIDEQAEQAA